MKKRSQSRLGTLLLLGALPLIFAQSATAQDPAFTKLTDNAGVSSWHFYPSTIRMLGKIFGGASPESLANLKGARLLYSVSDDGNFQRQMNDYTRERTNHGYELLAEMRHSGFNVRALLKEGKQPINLFYFDGDEALFALEIVGEIGPELMQQLMKLDVQSAAGAFGIFKEEESEELINEENEIKSDTVEIQFKFRP